MGRALTGNALIGTFDSEEASDARKDALQPGGAAHVASIRRDLAATLAL